MPQASSVGLIRECGGSAYAKPFGEEPLGSLSALLRLEYHLTKHLSSAHLLSR